MTRAKYCVEIRTGAGSVAASGPREVQPTDTVSGLARVNAYVCFQLKLQKKAQNLKRNFVGAL